MTLEEQNMHFAWEKVHLGIEKNYMIFNEMTPSQKKATALKIIRVVMKHELHMTVEQFKCELTPQILESMKLMPLIKYLQLPFAFNPKTDCPIIAMMLESSNGLIDEVELTYKVYDSVQDGTMSRYPKEFFADTDGWYRLLLCLKIALNKQKTFHDPDEMFAFMMKNGQKFLKQNNLSVPFRMHYCDESPLLLLFDAFPEEVQEEYQPYFDKYMAIEQEKKEKSAQMKKA